MRRAILLAMCSFILLLCACEEQKMASESSETSKEPSTVFDGLKLAERLDCDWVFLPEKAIPVRTAENGEILEATFKGCEAKEINGYAKDIFTALTDKGYTVYDATESHSPKKLESFLQADIGLDFAGVAYRYYYSTESRIYMLTLKYYGCADGTYGNGQSTLQFSDVTDNASSLIKE